MKQVVVDASVAVKWLVPEVHSDAAARLLDGEILLCAPDLIAVEVAGTLWKKVRRGELTSREAGAIRDAFDAMPLELVAARTLLPAALHIALALDRTVHESLYVALAAAQKCPLVTADRKLYAAIAASSLGDSIRWVSP
jgi:predicted nucleic acid-binding protein